MQELAGGLVCSPSDLNHFLECAHLIRLERDRAGHPRAPRDAHAELLAAKGLAHEQAWLERFRAQGLRVVEMHTAGAQHDWDRMAAQTLAAMRDGADVIYQGVLVDDGWRGVSDFLVKVPAEGAEASTFGPWRYEAWDTKLARRSRTSFLLQLCFYSGQLARLQGRDPEWMHVVLGTGQTDRFRYADFAAYYRGVRRRFVEAVRTNGHTYPYPVAHCRLCEHTRTCDGQRQADDHLSLVAGISRQQVERLNEAGVRTVAQLGGIDPGLRVGIGRAALERLRHQAALQTHHRQHGDHRYDLLPLDERSGFRLLPAPSPGDIFFDMEGDPYFEPEHGLEYLFGAVTTDTGREEFRAFQALDRQEEQLAFEQFIDFVHERLRQWPDLHVYHYAAYETTALKRLMSDHATREDELDDLLRREVFVDLYQVVRQSMRISHPSYSIKKVRTFFMEGAGEGAVKDGGDSILEFERWRESRDPAILQAITDYNREDCVSTVRLRDWLLERRQEAERTSGVAVPWKPAKTETTLTPARVQEDAHVRALREALQLRGDAESSTLAYLLDYHRREDKPEWWAYYDRQKKSLDDLLDDTQAIASLEPVAGVAPEPAARSLVHTLAFPPQEFKLAPPDDVEDPFTGRGAGTIVWLDAAAGRLGLKRGPKLAANPLPVAVVAGKPLPTTEQRQAIQRVADAVLHDTPAFAAARALLACEQPRIRGHVAGAPIQTLDLETQKALVAALDHSYLFVQGPPGSGKTWTAARLIVSLIQSGRRVGVAATSHKAIHNLLEAVEAVAAGERVAFTGLKKSSTDKEESRFESVHITSTDEPKACERTDADLIAGTAWLFAREGMTQRLDYLFIDEAGQVSLADAVAMSTAARNVVLLGDPQQLPHVTQGVHPEGSGVSVLEHLLESGSGRFSNRPYTERPCTEAEGAGAGRFSKRPYAERPYAEPACGTGGQTVREDRGLFLARSFRMHPDICAFISELSYDGRLTSAPGREQQRVESPGLRGAGVRYCPVPHEGNGQQSVEEARVVDREVRRLLDGGSFTDADGRTRLLTAADVLVVAPYNMQVRCLREYLPQDVQVGTVDKFQGREAPVVFFSMASSSGEDVPRGLEFLFSRNRLNVALSRGQALAVLVCSPRLLEARCRTVDQMRLVNAVCRFVERAG